MRLAGAFAEAKTPLGNFLVGSPVGRKAPERVPKPDVVKASFRAMKTVLGGAFLVGKLGLEAPAAQASHKKPGKPQEARRDTEKKLKSSRRARERA